jgi:hypothetical protein
MGDLLFFNIKPRLTPFRVFIIMDAFKNNSIATNIAWRNQRD